MWSTPPGPYRIRSSWWGRPFSTAAIPASSCRAAPPSPAMAGSQGPPCGRLDCLTVPVSARMTQRLFFHVLSMSHFVSTQILDLANIPFSTDKAPECQRGCSVIFVHLCVRWCDSVKCLICKCYANAPYPSGLRQVAEGVEIIHESCHFSQTCQPSAGADALTCFETGSAVSFQLRIPSPVKTLVSLTTATRSCPRDSTCPENRSPLSATKATSSSERPP